MAYPEIIDYVNVVVAMILKMNTPLFLFRIKTKNYQKVLFLQTDCFKLLKLLSINDVKEIC